ncbi:MAG TPA: retropepsin-like aspartic protease [Candidatus Xenobia bacterium]|jgi:hypothetical protein
MRRASLLVALLWLLTTGVRAETIPLTFDHGVWKIPVQINDVMTLKFVVDSGASDVCIPEDIALQLQKAGTLGREDVLPDGISLLADGSRHKSHRFRIRQLAIGQHVLTNVAGTVTPAQGPLLLGESCLQQLPGWQLDYKNKVLSLQELTESTPALPSATGDFVPTPRARVHLPPATTAPDEPPPESNPWPLIALIVCGAVVLAVAMLWSRPGGAPPPPDTDPNTPVL